jgi:urease accessory protein
MTSRIAATAALLLATTPALAHTGAAPHTQGLVAGLLHPLTGVDHLMAMLGVGLWAGLAGRRAVWAWPMAFLAAMAAGGAAGLHGLQLPWIEAGIAISLAGITAAVVFGLRPSVALGAALCAVFAVFHGLAHGMELPGEANAGAYAAGFLLATASLHAAGLMLALSAPRWLPRTEGVSRR